MLRTLRPGNIQGGLSTANMLHHVEVLQKGLSASNILQTTQPTSSSAPSSSGSADSAPKSKDK